jgi:hypothetical protein
MARYLLPPGSKTPLQNPNPALHLIGCVYWTDGHSFNPYMHRRVSGLMRRPSDGFVFWEDEALDLGIGDPDQPMGKLTWDDEEVPHAPEREPTIRLHPTEWEKLEYVESATEEDYFRALDSGLASTRERELFVRKKLLQIHNHPVRYGEYLPDSSRHDANRKALLDMLSGDDMEELLLLVELLREARAIDQARDVLQYVTIDPSDYLFHKFNRIRELCDQAISAVSVWEGKIEVPQPCWEHYRKLQ